MLGLKLICWCGMAGNQACLYECHNVCSCKKLFMCFGNFYQLKAVYYKCRGTNEQGLFFIYLFILYDDALTKPKMFYCRGVLFNLI